MKVFIILTFFISSVFCREFSIKPGKVRFINFSLPEASKDFTLHCGSKVYLLDVDLKNNFSTYISESYFSTRKSYKCFVEGISGKKHLLNIKVNKISYPFETLTVSRSKVDLSKKDLDRVIKEKNRLKEIYSKSIPIMYFNKPFVKPVDSIITSQYGKSRVFNKKRKGQHLGTDFRARTGASIYSSNIGKVVLAENLFFSGNTIIIDHGFNIFSMYGHLSKVLVKVGQRVNQKEKIGLAGATGRVTAAHLHWGLKISNSWVDGMSLISESEKQFPE